MASVLRSSWKIRQNGGGGGGGGGWGAWRLAGFFYWNTHFLVYLAASNRGWEARRPDLARKFTRMGAGRLGGLIQLV